VHTTNSFPPVIFLCAPFNIQGGGFSSHFIYICHEIFADSRFALAFSCDVQDFSLFFLRMPTSCTLSRFPAFPLPSSCLQYIMILLRATSFDLPMYVLWETVCKSSFSFDCLDDCLLFSFSLIGTLARPPFPYFGLIPPPLFLHAS